MYTRPSLTQYVVARLITIFIFVTSLYILATVIVPKEFQNTAFHLSLFVISLLLVLGSVYIGAKRVKRELKVVEKYLSGVEEYENFNRQALFFTQEFENINVKLIDILQLIKKKELKKRKYHAKIKLKNRQRSDMLSAIAHEFRNPIAATMGYAQTLNDDDDIPPALRKKFLSKIYNNGQKIEELLSRLLLWNRFESGEQKMQISTFDMLPLVKDVIHNLNEKYKNREILVNNAHLVIKADKALMEIVIKNLIENALKYSREQVEVKIEGNKVSVIDRGVGIAPEHIDKVTKKFYRSGEHSWDNSMGLGLAIVKQILSLHHSMLVIESEEHKGSTFSFVLPSF